MPTSSTTSHFARWLRWLAKTPTGFHLWSAECELQAADTRNLAPPLQKARARNLDLLRAYRRRGEFPHNTHEPTKPAPCFVDSAGRQCAVAYLMNNSGAAAAAEKIARQANYARIRDMHFAELETWTDKSGLTKAELARIQPAYAPTWEAAIKYGEIVYTVWFVGAVAVNSIVFNTCRLICAYRPRLTTMVLGIALGIFLLYYSFRIRPIPFAMTSLDREIGSLQSYAFGIGILSVICAILPLCLGRGKWRPPASDSAPTLAKVRDTVTPGGEHVTVKHGRFKSGSPPGC